ncbi:glycoside hydrolase family 128 protein [Hebeloma cylindrosporum]|uniref:Glycoside hydrolase family 128 protein n=1 Tax=Hebeloma cylindrosporum TaxID=76867 RepID=A0A0C3CV22_HEBCY|nr:glycoside hydrolase family 128 protein [Hebeloma cylindrosporum h7]
MFLRASFLYSLIACFSFSAAHTKNPKRGIGYAGDLPGDIINANQTKSLISWQYNWANIPPDYLATSNVTYIPMQWGAANVDTFADDVKAQGASTILTFNEPDYLNESNIPPDQAAKLWLQFIEPLKASGVRLGGPAVTASGRPWLNSFFQACNNCTIDFLPLHWYGTGTEGFYGYIWDVHTQFPQYPIWITEYAETSPNDTVVFEFMNQTMVYLDSLDWIERYSWFGYFRPRPDVHYNLLRGDGGLTPLGELYLGAKTVHTQNITEPTSTYKTVNGADIPNQGPPTAWPVVNSASRPLLTVAMSSQSLLATITLIISFFGTQWDLY